MADEKKPTRRIHQRFACDIPVELHAHGEAARPIQGRLLNIGMGGASLESTPELAKGAAYHFHFEAGETKFRLMGRVIWKYQIEPKRWERPPQIAYYGVSFNLASRQEIPLKALIDELRRKSWPPELERGLENYWNL